MYINKATILGNLTRDPEMRALPSGIKVTSFSLATNRTWKGADGTRQEATEYHNAVAFAKPAELIAQYCKKGSSLYIEGRLQTRSWEQEGQKNIALRSLLKISNLVRNLPVVVQERIMQIKVYLLKRCS